MTQNESSQGLVNLLMKEYNLDSQEASEGARGLVGLVELLFEIDQNQNKVKNEECGEYPPLFSAIVA